MLIKVFDLKKSDIFNYYVAEYHNAKQVTEVGFECEYFTDALGTKFPKRVSSNEIRILVDKSFRSINLYFPQVFTSEERNSRVADFKVISAEIKENFNFIKSQFLDKPLSILLIEELSGFLEELLDKKVLFNLIYHDYKVTYWVQE